MIYKHQKLPLYFDDTENKIYYFDSIFYQMNDDEYNAVIISNIYFVKKTSLLKPMTNKQKVSFNLKLLDVLYSESCLITCDMKATVTDETFTAERLTLEIEPIAQRQNRYEKMWKQYENEERFYKHICNTVSIPEKSLSKTESAIARYEYDKKYLIP